MNKILLPAILFVIAIGIYFTYTQGQYEKVKELRGVSDSYQRAIDSSEELIRKRDQVVNAYNSISESDRARLEQILPSNVDVIRLIIDIRNVVERRGGKFSGVNIGTEKIKVGAAEQARPNTGATEVSPDGAVAEEDAKGIKPTLISLEFSATYEDFVAILKDIESSLRLVEISKISFEPGETAMYDYTVELKTFWIKQ